MFIIERLITANLHCMSNLMLLESMCVQHTAYSFVLLGTRVDVGYDAIACRTAMTIILLLFEPIF